MVLGPAAVTLVFSVLAARDSGLRSALPYALALTLCLVYLARPMLAVWMLLFCGFAVYTVVGVLAPWIGLNSGRVSEWLVSAGLGAVPTVLLWVARPRRDPTDTRRR